jgi:DNA-binding transcriptional ArsR family regulator
LAIGFDPVVGAIVDQLLEEPATAAEIAARTGLPAESVRHRLRKLIQAEIVRRAGRTDRRGIAEHLYRCDVSDTILASDELVDLHPAKVDEANVRRLRTMFREAIAAIDAGAISVRDESVFVRVAIGLDDDGRRKVARLHDAVVREAAAAMDRGRDRLARGAGQAVDAGGAVLLFEAEGDPWPGPLVEGGPLKAGRRRPRRGPIDPFTTVCHPLRMKLMDALGLRPASAADLAEQLSVPVERVRYQLRCLYEAGLLSVYATRRRRGTLERVFTWGTDNVVDTFEAPVEEQIAQGRLWVTECFRDALASARSGAFAAGRDFHLDRLAARIDEQAFVEVSGLMSGLLDRLLELRESAAERWSEGAETGRPFISEMLFYERPGGGPSMNASKATSSGATSVM